MWMAPAEPLRVTLRVTTGPPANLSSSFLSYIEFLGPRRLNKYLGPALCRRSYWPEFTGEVTRCTAN